MAAERSERRIVLLIAAVQFINILAFMMVMPLGPDFARALAIPTSRLGLIGASYTAAAALAGILGAVLLDRFDRRKALVVALAGLVVATAAGGFTSSFGTMLIARLCAGSCGGPAASLALAIIADVIPSERRGRAMGAVMGSFSAATVLGVPAGLELARIGGWRLPFFAIAVLGVAVAASVVSFLPPMTIHLSGARERTRGASAIAFLFRRHIALMLAGAAALMVGHYALTPNLPAYLQYNFEFPRAQFGVLYAVGGLLSFMTMRLSGRLTDRHGSTAVTAVGTAVYALLLFVYFIYPIDHRRPIVLALFSSFMVTFTFRLVAIQVLASRVPTPAERARFMSALSAVQHLGAAIGAVMAARILHALPGGRLDGMDRVAWVVLALTIVVPFLVGSVESEGWLRPRHGHFRRPFFPPRAS